MIVDYQVQRTDGTVSKGTTTPRAIIETEFFFDEATSYLFDISERSVRTSAMWFIVWRSEHPEVPYRDEDALLAWSSTVVGYPTLPGLASPLPPPSVGGTDNDGAS